MRLILNVIWLVLRRSLDGLAYALVGLVAS